MKKIGIILLSGFLCYCGAAEKPLIKPPKEFSIFALSIGKDFEQAKNRALSILSDMRSGYRFVTDNNTVVSIIENEVNFIVAQKVYEKKLNTEKSVYVCKMLFQNPHQEGYGVIQIIQKVKIEKLIQNDLKELFAEILNQVFSGYIKKQEKLVGFIYITGLPDFSVNDFTETDMNVNFTIIYKNSR